MLLDLALFCCHGILRRNKSKDNSCTWAPVRDTRWTGLEMGVTSLCGERDLKCRFSLIFSPALTSGAFGKSQGWHSSYTPGVHREEVGMISIPIHSVLCRGTLCFFISSSGQVFLLLKETYFST